MLLHFHNFLWIPNVSTTYILIRSFEILSILGADILIAKCCRFHPDYLMWKIQIPSQIDIKLWSFTLSKSCCQAKPDELAGSFLYLPTRCFQFQYLKSNHGGRMTRKVILMGHVFVRSPSSTFALDIDCDVLLSLSVKGWGFIWICVNLRSWCLLMHWLWGGLRSQLVLFSSQLWVTAIHRRSRISLDMRVSFISMSCSSTWNLTLMLCSFVS